MEGAREQDRRVGGINTPAAARLAWSLWGLVIVLAVASFILRHWIAPESQHQGTWHLEDILWWSVLIPVLVPAYATVGALVVARRPGNPSQTANFERAEGLDVTENILQANPDIKGIFAQNDEMALGAVRALEGKAGTDVKIVGFDGTEEALTAIQSGKMNATVAQQPDKMGSLGVQNAMKIIDGKSVPKKIPVEVKLVTKENVSQFLE
jgi:hypothetical protein